MGMGSRYVRQETSGGFLPFELSETFENVLSFQQHCVVLLRALTLSPFILHAACGHPVRRQFPESSHLRNSLEYLADRLKTEFMFLGSRS